MRRPRRRAHGRYLPRVRRPRPRALGRCLPGAPEPLIAAPGVGAPRRRLRGIRPTRVERPRLRSLRMTRVGRPRLRPRVRSARLRPLRVTRVRHARLRPLRVTRVGHARLRPLRVGTAGVRPPGPRPVRVSLLRVSLLRVGHPGVGALRVRRAAIPARVMIRCRVVPGAGIGVRTAAIRAVIRAGISSGETGVGTAVRAGIGVRNRIRRPRGRIGWPGGLVGRRRGILRDGFEIGVPGSRRLRCRRGVVHGMVDGSAAAGVAGIALAGLGLPFPGDLVDPGRFVVPAVGAARRAPAVHRAPGQAPDVWLRSVTKFHLVGNGVAAARSAG
ncbi:hypothetical protein L083_1874 [Actinoplanes sp. N902-109]|nr:hypothetical protein L083_1874 [Actinoplanes sp. N902-109]